MWQNIKKTYQLSDSVSVNKLTKFGFKTRADTYILNKFLYEKWIMVKFVADLHEHTLSWTVWDCVKSKKYYAFYDEINTRSTVESIDEFNRIIDEMIKENIIKGE